MSKTSCQHCSAKPQFSHRNKYGKSVFVSAPPCPIHTSKVKKLFRSIFAASGSRRPTATFYEPDQKYFDELQNKDWKNPNNSDWERGQRDDFSDWSSSDRDYYLQDDEHDADDVFSDANATQWIKQNDLQRQRTVSYSNGETRFAPHMPSRSQTEPIRNNRF
jgi:hypothetical protein